MLRSTHFLKSVLTRSNRVRHISDLLPLTKICATIGPASEQLSVLPSCVAAGMRIMRINFSHATYDEANLRIKNLKLSPGRNISGKNLRAVMLDTQGPEIRTGSFPEGVKDVQLVKGNKIILTTNDSFRNSQTGEKIWISYKLLTDTISVGSTILLDDGAVELAVDSITSDGTECTIINTGSLGNKKGVNIPGTKTQILFH